MTESSFKARARKGTYNLFGAVFPLNANSNGFPRGEASISLES